MFKELMPVIADRPLTITVAGVPDGKIRVCVIPQLNQKDGKINDKVGHQKEVAKIPEASIKALTTPLTLTGTPEELDAELAQRLTSYTATHVTLQQGIAQATQEIADALKAIEDRNKAKTKAKAAGPEKKDSKEEKSEDKKAKAEASATLPLSWVAPSADSTVPAAENAAESSTQGERQETLEEQKEVTAND